MFDTFLYLLRGKGLDVSLNEWVALNDALDRGLAHSSLTEFYYLCRSVLIKSETDFDKFDGAFLEFFKDIEFLEDIPQELLNWLNKPKETPDNYDEEIAKQNLALDYERIEQMLRERIAEQDGEHNGGKYWVGTGGMSVFGNNGNSPKGIRVGGESKYHRAFRVAGERHFKDFNEDKILDSRQFQMAFRKLRQYSTKSDAPKTELDLDATIEETGDNAGRLKIVYDRPRKNMVKVLMLMDSGGSMDYYRQLCGQLFSSLRKSNHFKDLKFYYFHNSIYSKLYTDSVCMPGRWIDTDMVLRTLGSDYKVIIVGDAAMAPYELFGGGYYSYGSETKGIDWFKKIKGHFSHVVWLNPSEMDYVPGNYWRETLGVLQEEFDMYPLSVNGLETALKKLMVSR